MLSCHAGFPSLLSTAQEKGPGLPQGVIMGPKPLLTFLELEGKFWPQVVGGGAWATPAASAARPTSALRPPGAFC